MPRVIWAIALLCTFGVHPVQAEPIKKSLRPESRTVAEQDQTVVTFSTQRSVRPLARPFSKVHRVKTEPVAPQSTAEGFPRWIDSFKREAMTRGVSASILDDAFRDVQYDSDIIKRDRNQSEFTKSIWEYLEAEDEMIEQYRADQQRAEEDDEAIGSRLSNPGSYGGGSPSPMSNPNGTF